MSTCVVKQGFSVAVEWEVVHCSKSVRMLMFECGGHVGAFKVVRCVV